MHVQRWHDGGVFRRPKEFDPSLERHGHAFCGPWALPGVFLHERHSSDSSEVRQYAQKSGESPEGQVRIDEGKGRKGKSASFRSNFLFYQPLFRTEKVSLLKSWRIFPIFTLVSTLRSLSALCSRTAASNSTGKNQGRKWSSAHGRWRSLSWSRIHLSRGRRTLSRSSPNTASPRTWKRSWNMPERRDLFSHASARPWRTGFNTKRGNDKSDRASLLTKIFTDREMLKSTKMNKK